MSTHICSYCGLSFDLPDDNFTFLKFERGNGSQIFLEKRGRTELIHRLESEKRTKVILARQRAKDQIIKAVKTGGTN